jgi:hypothetical protein
MREEGGAHPHALHLVHGDHGKFGDRAPRAKTLAAGEAQGFQLPAPAVHPDRDEGEVVMPIHLGKALQFLGRQGRFFDEETQTPGAWREGREAAQQQFAVVRREARIK